MIASIADIPLFTRRFAAPVNDSAGEGLPTDAEGPAATFPSGAGAPGLGYGGEPAEEPAGDPGGDPAGDPAGDPGGDPAGDPAGAAPEAAGDPGEPAPGAGVAAALLAAGAVGPGVGHVRVAVTGVVPHSVQVVVVAANPVGIWSAARGFPTLSLGHDSVTV